VRAQVVAEAAVVVAVVGIKLTHV